jgi:hypothetical protein
MKLRFRNNSIRLRLNQTEVRALASGSPLQETVLFPGLTRLTYVLEPSARFEPQASFLGGEIRIAAPPGELRTWAEGESIGMYFDLPSGPDTTLRVAIEKDLECVDAPVEEHDPNAFPRQMRKNC